MFSSADASARPSSQYDTSTFAMTTGGELGDSTRSFTHVAMDDPRNDSYDRRSSSSFDREPHHYQHTRPHGRHPNYRPTSPPQPQPRSHNYDHNRHRPPAPLRNGRTQSTSSGSDTAFRGREFFKCPELDPRMKKKLVQLANETANHLIRDTLEPDHANLSWKPMVSIKGIDILRGYERDGTSSTPTAPATPQLHPNTTTTPPTATFAKDSTCLRGVAQVNASIEEFAMLFKLDSTKALAEHGLLFNPDLLDMATLYALVQPSGDHPRRYVGIKWCLVQSPSRIFRNRDFCYLECQKEFRDAKGRRGWVRSMHSIKMPCCPSLEKSHSIVRASLYRCGLIAVETDKPGVLDTTYTIEMDLKGHFPELFQPKFLTQRIAALASIDKFLQQQRLSSTPLLGDLDIPASKAKGTCQFCFREFSTFTRRHICRKCGEGVCRHCSDDWMLDIPVIGRKKVRICTVCSAEARFCHVTPLSTRASLSNQANLHGGQPPLQPGQQPSFNLKYKPMQERSTLQSAPRSVSIPSEYDHEIDPSEYFARQLQLEQQRQQQIDEHDRDSHAKFFDADYTADFDEYYNAGIRGTADLTGLWEDPPPPSPEPRVSYQQPVNGFMNARRGSDAVPMRRDKYASDTESVATQRSRAQTLSHDANFHDYKEPNHYTYHGQNSQNPPPPPMPMGGDRPYPPSSRYTVVGGRLERASSFDAARHMEEKFLQYEQQQRLQQQQQRHQHNPYHQYQPHYQNANSRRSQHGGSDQFPSYRGHQQYPSPLQSPSSNHYEPPSPSRHSMSYRNDHTQPRQSVNSSRQSFRVSAPPVVQQPPAPAPPRNVALEFVTQHLRQSQAPKPTPEVKPKIPLPKPKTFHFGTAPSHGSILDDEPEPPQSPEFVGAGDVEYVESESGEWVASRRLEKPTFHVPFLDLASDQTPPESSSLEDVTLTGVARTEGNPSRGGSSTIQVSVDVEQVIPYLVERLSQHSLRPTTAQEL